MTTSARRSPAVCTDADRGALASRQLTTLPRVRRLVAVVLDVVVILAFVAIGRSVHDHGVRLAGLASTGWPFLAGAGVGWLGTRAWGRPFAVVPSAVGIWLSCVAIGMVLRVLAGQGTAFAFVLVALGFPGAGLIGWRLAASLVLREQRSRRRARYRTT